MTIKFLYYRIICRKKKITTTTNPAARLIYSYSSGSVPNCEKGTVILLLLIPLHLSSVSSYSTTLITFLKTQFPLFRIFSLFACQVLYLLPVSFLHAPLRLFHITISLQWIPQFKNFLRAAFLYFITFGRLCQTTPWTLKTIRMKNLCESVSN